ncbi:MAG: UDP-N-acetylmuramoyl-L-alanine--D-glutamate ligase [Elusimicrobia bacterium CG06_land_8_20_14_3_00_38_11]|nr:MAG: UDP-N-acetylmuramoyl-L-alanine--D-glutamate ligase [Elusimicrobia bacterium CG06_land_8_20_14_3_00_38_11]
MKKIWEKVAVLGAAKTGISCANYFSKKGADVLLSEAKKKNDIQIKNLSKKVKLEFGGHSQKILSCDLIIPSPGVPGDIPILIDAKKRGIEILSDIEIFFLFAKYKMIVAITGTNGKTTTTSMIGETLSDAGYKNIVCGNIGAPVCDFIEKSDAQTYIVMEVSSYQLEYTKKFAPHISAVLNITPDHLHRHKTIENYADIKSKIFANQKKNDFCILNKEDEFCLKLSKKCPSTIRFFSAKENKKILNLKVPGAHNIENALASIEMLSCAGISEKTILRSLSDFKGVEHRLEFVRVLGGVRYINDSKSTNVSSTLVAMKSFSQPLILILGGRDKGSPYTPLIPLIKNNVKKIIAIGEAKKKIFTQLKGASDIIMLDNVEAAVKKASDLAVSGDIVVLSPACASFDQFNNYEERGKFFKEVVNNL